MSGATPSLTLRAFVTCKKKQEKNMVSLSTPRRHIGGLEVQLYSFFTLVLNRGEWSTYTGRFTPEPWYPLNSWLIGLHSRSGRFGEEENFFSLHMDNFTVNGRIILKWILMERDGARAGLIWLGIGTGGGLL